MGFCQDNPHAFLSKYASVTSPVISLTWELLVVQEVKSWPTEIAVFGSILA